MAISPPLVPEIDNGRPVGSGGWLRAPSRPRGRAQHSSELSSSHSRFCSPVRTQENDKNHTRTPSTFSFGFKMFVIKKLILAAACVALALGPVAVAAEPQNVHLRIHINGHSMTVKKNVGASAHLKFAQASSMDSSGDDDAEGSGDSDDSKDDSDDATGSKDSDDSGAFCNGEGEYTMSVEHIEGIFCVKGPSCSADNADGVCPGPQEGLPFGSFCGKVSSGVSGCKPFTETPPTDAPGGGGEDASGKDDDVDSADFCAGDDESEMSIEGAEGIYCVKGQACVSSIADGACPGPQKGLPFGSYCGTVKSGVYGCKVNNEAVSKHHKKAAVNAKKADNVKKGHNAKPVQQSKKVHKKSKKVDHAKKPAVLHKKYPAHQKKSAIHEQKKVHTHAKKKIDAHQKKKAEVHVSKTHHGKKNN